MSLQLVLCVLLHMIPPCRSNSLCLKSFVWYSSGVFAIVRCLRSLHLEGAITKSPPQFTSTKNIYHILCESFEVAESSFSLSAHLGGYAVCVMSAYNPQRCRSIHIFIMIYWIISKAGNGSHRGVDGGIGAPPPAPNKSNHNLSFSLDQTLFISGLQ